MLLFLLKKLFLDGFCKAIIYLHKLFGFFAGMVYSQNINWPVPVFGLEGFGLLPLWLITRFAPEHFVLYVL